MASVDATQHDRIVFIGDVHGDLLGLVECMLHARLISCTTEFRTLASACHVGRGRDRVSRPHLRVDDEGVRWIGGSSCVILLGDVLDNQRGDDPMGRCALPGTQQAVLTLLCHLHRAARAHRGRVCLVLGNHEVLNVCSSDQTYACKHMFPSHFLFRGEPQRLCVPTKGGRLATDERWRKIVLAAVRELQSKAVLLVTSGAKVVAVCVHGFLHDQTCGAMGLTPLSGTAAEKLKGAVANATLVNRLYDDALFHRRGLVYDAIMGRGGSIDADNLPTWCRASPSQSLRLPLAARRYFATQAVVKGHDIQHGGVPVVHRANGGGVVVFADVGMSRSMRPPDSTASPVGYVVWKDGAWQKHAWSVTSWKTIAHE